MVQDFQDHSIMLYMILMVCISYPGPAVPFMNDSFSSLAEPALSPIPYWTILKPFLLTSDQDRSGRLSWGEQLLSCKALTKTSSRRSLPSLGTEDGNQGFNIFKLIHPYALTPNLRVHSFHIRAPALVRNSLHLWIQAFLKFWHSYNKVVCLVFSLSFNCRRWGSL